MYVTYLRVYYAQTNTLLFLPSFTSQRILTHDAPEMALKEARCLAQHEDQCSSGNISAVYRSHLTPSCSLFTYNSSLELAGERQASPYKELDDFVLKLVCRDGLQGSKHEQKEFCIIAYHVQNKPELTFTSQTSGAGRTSCRSSCWCTISGSSAGVLMWVATTRATTSCEQLE